MMRRIRVRRKASTDSSFAPFAKLACAGLPFRYATLCGFLPPGGRPLGLYRRLPELDLIPVQIIDPGKATVGFIHAFGIDLYPLLF